MLVDEWRADTPSPVSVGDSEFAISPPRTDWGTPIMACAAEVPSPTEMPERYRSILFTPICASADGGSTTRSPPRAMSRNRLWYPLK